MIKTTLHLSDIYPITIEAKNRQELIKILAEYDRRNLIVMLTQAIEQLSKRDSQLAALGVMIEKTHG